MEKQALREQESALDQQIEELREKIDPAEQQFKTVEKEYTDLQADSDGGPTGRDGGRTPCNPGPAGADAVARIAAMHCAGGSRKISAWLHLNTTPEVVRSNPTATGRAWLSSCPMLTEISPEIEENINRQRAMLRRMGPINPEVQNEYQLGERAL